MSADKRKRLRGTLVPWLRVAVIGLRLVNVAVMAMLRRDKCAHKSHVKARL